MPECPACRVAYIDGESHVCEKERGWPALRLWAGFIVQPFAAAALGFVGFPLIDRSGRALYGGRPSDSLDAALSVASGAAFAAFIVTVCVAWPAVAWLSSRGRLTLRQVLWSGVALGNVPLAIIVALAAATRSAAWGPQSFWPLGAVRALATGSIFGLVGAALFWVIAVRGTSRHAPSHR